MGGIYIISILIMAVSWLVGNTMQRRMKQYSEMPIDLTGKQVAEKMLRDNGIFDVKVVSVPGALTDHYNPADKTVNLSDWVYAQSNVAAAAVAAHECGHAVQPNTAYAWLTMRSKLVPAVQISSITLVAFSTTTSFATIVEYASIIKYIPVIKIYK